LPLTYLRNIEQGKKEEKSWYQYVFPMSVADSEGATVRADLRESEEEPEADSAARIFVQNTDSHPPLGLGMPQKLA
jgi:hypothetical protein